MVKVWLDNKIITYEYFSLGSFHISHQRVGIFRGVELCEAYVEI